MSEAIDYGDFKVTFHTAWGPLSWDWWDDLFPLLIDGPDAAVAKVVQAHYGHRVAVRQAVIGWLGIHCNTCDIRIWEKEADV